MTAQTSSTNHNPVMLKEVLHYLSPTKGEKYLDLTAGYGGHAKAVLKMTGNGPATLVDRDENAIKHLSSDFTGAKITLFNKDYLKASQDLNQKGEKFDLILADLGISSPHLNMADRGFSFRTEGPLDMRMNQGQELDAYRVVNTYSHDRLAAVIGKYGEEPKAGKIAEAIVRGRPIKKTTELAELVAKAIGHKRLHRQKVHPATKTFQAIRIEVNDELGQLEQTLPIWLELLKPSGRIVVISFHSLEDRLVKEFFKQVGGNTYDADLKILTKHPITASQKELVLNPRARSAKLRAAVKINKQKKGSAHAYQG